jgi:hypothetical protein
VSNTLPPCSTHRAEHAAHRRHVLAAGDLREGRGAPQADDRKPLTRGGDGAGDELLLGGPEQPRVERQRGLPHAVLADALASLLNQSLAVWEMSPTGTPVEAQVIRWLCELLGYPPTRTGRWSPAAAPPT